LSNNIYRFDIDKARPSDVVEVYLCDSEISDVDEANIFCSYWMVTENYIGWFDFFMDFYGTDSLWEVHFYLKSIGIELTPHYDCFLGGNTIDLLKHYLDSQHTWKISLENIDAEKWRLHAVYRFYVMLHIAQHNKMNIMMSCN
jgi:hypothetical protein